MKRYDAIKCWIKYKLLKKKRTLEATHKFWEEAKNDNWDKYKDGIEKSRFLWTLINTLTLKKDARILELGCNIGRNLNFLYQKGYTYLDGIELNKEAVRQSEKIFPNMKANIMNYMVEDYFDYTIAKYNLIFTMAVLEHLPKESEWVFGEIVKRTDYLITVEDEKSINKICFPRNYKKIFENLGMIQLYEFTCDGVHPSLHKGFKARIFTK